MVSCRLSLSSSTPRSSRAAAFRWDSWGGGWADLLLGGWVGATQDLIEICCSCWLRRRQSCGSKHAVAPSSSIQLTRLLPPPLPTLQPGGAYGHLDGCHLLMEYCDLLDLHPAPWRMVKGHAFQLLGESLPPPSRRSRGLGVWRADRVLAGEASCRRHSSCAACHSWRHHQLA